MHIRGDKGEAPRILLLYADQSAMDYAARCLRERGLWCGVATSLAELQRATLIAQPDIVLTDFLMRSIDSLDVKRFCRLTGRYEVIVDALPASPARLAALHRKLLEVHATRPVEGEQIDRADRGG